MSYFYIQQEPNEKLLNNIERKSEETLKYLVVI
jgi:hypothetical protein